MKVKETIRPFAIRINRQTGIMEIQMGKLEEDSTYIELTEAQRIKILTYLEEAGYIQKTERD